MAPEGVRNEGGNGKFDARRPPNPFCAKLAHSVRAENRSTENAQSASVPPPFPSPGSTPRSFLTPSRHLGPHTQAPRLRPPKPFIWEQQPALYASDRLFESRARAERRASTTLGTLSKSIENTVWQQASSKSPQSHQFPTPVSHQSYIRNRSKPDPEVVPLRVFSGVFRNRFWARSRYTDGLRMGGRKVMPLRVFSGVFRNRFWARSRYTDGLRRWSQSDAASRVFWRVSEEVLGTL